MRTVAAPLLLALAFIGPLWAEPAPAKSPIRWPDVPAPVPFPVPVPPGGAIVLGADKYLVLDCDVPCIVLASPAALLSVQKATGPVSIPSRFVVGGTGPGLTTFSGKFLYLVTAAGQGQAELIVWPVGGKESDVMRRAIDLGKGPKPPPDPPPGPVDPLAVELRALYAADPAPAELKRQVAQQLAALYLDGVALSGDAGLLTVGMFHEALKAKAGAASPGLARVRQRIGQELAGLLGSEPSFEFNAARRTAVAALMIRLAAALEVNP